MAIRRLNLRADDGAVAFPNETPVRLRFQYSTASFFAIAPVIPMPPVAGPTLLIIDESKWNGYIDHAQAIERGARAFWIKADQGVWSDDLFDVHTKDAIDAGADFGHYHFADPQQTNISPEQAARHCADMTAGVGNLSTWLDCERRGNLSALDLLDYYRRWIDTYAGITNKTVEIYTRFSFWNPYVKRSSYWRSNKIGLVTARYHLGLSTPWSDNNYYPLDWDFTLNEFDKWQHSADGNGMGEYFGAQSGSIDLGLFSGAENAFVSRYNLSSEPTQSEKVDKLWEIAKIEHPKYFL